MDAAGPTREGLGPSRRALSSRSNPKGRTGRKETSAHRRARRMRAADRLLLQVTAAAVRTASHHAGRPPACLIPLLKLLEETPRRLGSTPRQGESPRQGEGAKGGAASQGEHGAARGDTSCCRSVEHVEVAAGGFGGELAGDQCEESAGAEDSGRASARQGGPASAVLGQRQPQHLVPDTTEEVRFADVARDDGDLAKDAADNLARLAEALRQAGRPDSCDRVVADKNGGRRQEEGGLQAASGLQPPAGSQQCDRCGRRSDEGSKVTYYWWRGYSRCQQCEASGDERATTAAAEPMVTPPSSGYSASEAPFCSRSPWPFLRFTDLRSYGGTSIGSAGLLLRHIRAVAPVASEGARGGPHVALLGKALACLADRELQRADIARVPLDGARRGHDQADHERGHPGATSISGAASGDESGQLTLDDARHGPRLRARTRKEDQKPQEPGVGGAITRLAAGAVEAEKKAGAARAPSYRK